VNTHSEQELSDLRGKLLTMSSHAEAQVRRATEALMTRNGTLADQVKDGDDVLDQFELEVDEMAIHLLAKAPLATNLRLIAVAMKISQNLERVGDEATKIAKRTRDLIQEPPLKQIVDIPRLTDLSLSLLHRALDAFMNQDAPAARELIPADKEVDALNKTIYRDLANQMIADPQTISRALNLITIAKSLERIGDHAKNIAEETVYLCEARDIRHPHAATAAAT
jgi:phosphate transport system protein